MKSVGVGALSCVLGLSLLTACGQGESRQGSDEVSPNLTAPAAPAAPSDGAIAYFTGTANPATNEISIRLRSPSAGGLKTEATLPYGNAADSVYLHTTGVSWDGGTNTLTGTVQLVNRFGMPVAGAVAKIDSVVPSGVTSNAPWTYGTVAGNTTSSSQSWVFSLPSAANFSFEGHVEGDAPLPTTCVSGQSFTESWATNPLTSGRWISLAGSPSWAAGKMTLPVGSSNTQMWAGNRAWTNYTVSVPITFNSGGNSGITIRMGNVSAPLANDGGQMYYVGVDNSNVYLGRMNNGYAGVASAPVPIATGTAYTLSVTVNGSNIRVSVNGTQYINVTDASYGSGSVGLRTFAGSMSYGPLTVTCL